MSDASPTSLPHGIGGWLLVPVAGLVLTVGVGLYGISDIATSLDMLSLALFYKASITIEAVSVVLFWIALPAIAIGLLLVRSRHFPRAFVIANVALAVSSVLDPFFIAIDYDFSPNSLLYAAILAVWFLGWSWYMLTSARVKATFVN